MLLPCGSWWASLSCRSIFSSWSHEGLYEDFGRVMSFNIRDPRLKISWLWCYSLRDSNFFCLISEVKEMFALRVIGGLRGSLMTLSFWFVSVLKQLLSFWFSFLTVSATLCLIILLALNWSKKEDFFIRSSLITRCAEFLWLLHPIFSVLGSVMT